MKTRKLLSLLLTLTMILGLTACYNPFNEFKFTFTTEGNLYISGEQTITIKSDQEHGHFSDKVAASDFTLTGNLAGKTITSVKYISETEIELTLSGISTSAKSETFDYSDNYGYETIDISKHAFTENTTANAVVTFWHSYPSIKAISATSSLKGNIFTGMSIYTLSYGSFIPEYCTTEHIKTVFGGGTVEVSLENNKLCVTVKDYPKGEQEAAVVISLDAECTTFNYATTVAVGAINDENAMTPSAFD